MVIRRRLGAALTLLGRALGRAHRDGIGRRASALAFATLLALVPLLAVVSIFVAQTLREDDGRTLRIVAQLLPYREEAVVEALQSFVAQAESVSGLALVGFLITSLSTFFSVQEALFEIFGVTAPPSLARRLLAFTLLLFWGPVLIGSVYAGLLYLGQKGTGLGDLLRESTLLGTLPTVVTFLGLTMLYWRAAFGRIRLRHAMAGSAVATGLVELLKLGFVLYVESFTAVQRAVYGTFAIALFFVLSVQLTWWILLYGAEVAACLGRPAAELDRARGLRPDPWLALAALERLGGRGRPSLAAGQLADELGVPADALADHLSPLAERGLLESPLTSAGHWRLALAPARVRLETVFAAYEPDAQVAAADAPGAPLADLRRRLAGARAAALEGATLDDWLTRDRAGSAAGSEPGEDTRA